MKVLSVSNQGKVLLYRGIKIVYSKKYKIYYVNNDAFSTLKDAKSEIDNQDVELIKRINYLEKEIIDLQRENANLRKKIPFWKR